MEHPLFRGVYLPAFKTLGSSAQMLWVGGPFVAYQHWAASLKAFRPHIKAEWLLERDRTFAKGVKAHRFPTQVRPRGIFHLNLNPEGTNAIPLKARGRPSPWFQELGLEISTVQKAIKVRHVLTAFDWVLTAKTTDNNRIPLSNHSQCDHEFVLHVCECKKSFWWSRQDGARETWGENHHSVKDSSRPFLNVLLHIPNHHLRCLSNRTDSNASRRFEGQHLASPHLHSRLPDVHVPDPYSKYWNQPTLCILINVLFCAIVWRPGRSFVAHYIECLYDGDCQVRLDCSTCR